MKSAATMIKVAACTLPLCLIAPTVASPQAAPFHHPKAKPVVERIPKSFIAWEFDREPDGTQAIKGPNGLIWRGRMQLFGGPYRPNLVSPLHPYFQRPGTHANTIPPAQKFSPRLPPANH